MKKKSLIAVVILVLLGGAGYWYANYMGWLSNYGPDNLPTAEERQRMQEVERSSSQIAPNAVPGAGVRPKGSLPPKVVEQPISTSTASTTNITPAASTSTATTS